MIQHREVAVRAARLAGAALMKRFRRLTPGQIQKKGRHDIVTTADMEANEIVIRTIRRAFPDHDFLSEETGLEDNPTQYRWTIDPLDGTINYALQSPLFCTALSLIHRKRILLSVIYAPYMKELYVAEADRGARLNGKRIHVSKTKRLSEAVVLVGRTHLRSSHRNFARIQSHLETSAMSVRRLGSGSLDLAYTAAGRVDAMILAPPGVSLWDASAGALLVQEAGGRTTGIHGQPWETKSDGLIASNGKIHRQLLTAL